MQPHQERVVIERDMLKNKIVKLEAFIGTDIHAGLDGREQIRLASQLDFMRGYCNVLDERIKAFV